jgi:hypothetical protein
MANGHNRNKKRNYIPRAGIGTRVHIHYKCNARPLGVMDNDLS